MSKVKKSTPPTGNSSISQAKQLAEQKAKELLNFSFKYLTADHNKFCYYPHDAGYFV